MDHGGEAARPTMVGSTVVHGLASTVQGSEANIGSGAFDGQLGVAAAPPGSFSDFDLSALAGRGVVPVAAEFHLRHEPGPGGVAPPNIGASWRQPGPVHVALVGPQLPGGVVPVHDNYGYYSALQPRPGAGRGVVLAALQPGGGGAVYSGYHVLQPRPGAGHGDVRVDLLPDGVVGLLPGGVDAGYDNYFYYALQPRQGAEHREVLVDVLANGAGHDELFVGLLPGGEVLVDLLPDGAGHGEVFVGPLQGGGGAMHDDYGYYAWQLLPGARHGEVFIGLLQGGGGAMHDDYGYYAWQPRPAGAGHGEVFVGLLPAGGGAVHHDYGYYTWQPRSGTGRGEVLPEGVGMVFDGSGNFAQQTLPASGTMGADGTAGALRGPNLGAGYDGSVALADDLGAGYDNRSMVAEHLRRLLLFAGIGACSVAVNGLAGGPSSPAIAFHLFVLLLGGLLLVILHVLRV